MPEQRPQHSRYDLRAVTDMPKVTIRYTDYFRETIQRMCEDGLLLVTSGADGKPNVMTIGWGTLGVIWGRPVFLVLVRPSRHTYRRLEQVGEFTVNVPPRELAAGVNLQRFRKPGLLC